MLVQSLDWEEPLEKGMATHAGILAWKIPWTEQPGRLQSTGQKECDMTEHARIFMDCLISALAEACGVNDFVIYRPIRDLSVNKRQPYLTESRAAGIHLDY